MQHQQQNGIKNNQKPKIDQKLGGKMITMVTSLVREDIGEGERCNCAPERWILPDAKIDLSLQYELTI